MEQLLTEKYNTCLRFDEGEFYQTEEYQRAAACAERLRELLTDTFGIQISPLLEEYTAALYDVFEWEARHYFVQGYYAQ